MHSLSLAGMLYNQQMCYLVGRERPWGMKKVGGVV